MGPVRRGRRARKKSSVPGNHQSPHVSEDGPSAEALRAHALGIRAAHTREWRRPKASSPRNPDVEARRTPGTHTRAGEPDETLRIAFERADCAS